MTEQRPIDKVWDLEHRCAAWNLLYALTKKMNVSLSPFLTSAFTYLIKFFQNEQFVYYNEEPTADLFHLTFSAFFLACKSEGIIYKINQAIELYFKVAKRALTAEQRALFGNNYSNIPEGTQNRHFYKFISDAKATELYLCTYIDWQFIVEHPFSLMNHWFREIRPRVNSDPKAVEDFRKTRSMSVHIFCVLLVGNMKLMLDHDLVRISLNVALERFPIKSLSSDVIQQTLEKVLGNEYKMLNGYSKLVEDLEQQVNRYYVDIVITDDY